MLFLFILFTTLAVLEFAFKPRIGTIRDIWNDELTYIIWYNKNGKRTYFKIWKIKL